MTMNDQENGTTRDTVPLDPPPPPTSSSPKRKRWVRVCMWLCLITLLLIILVIVVLALTVFKVKQPKIQLVSSTVEGIAPKFDLTQMRVELNITLNLTILVNNPNHVRFQAGQGKSQLLYKGDEVGDVDINPGLIPSKGSATLVCMLTLQAARFADSGMMSLFRDITDGELDLELKTRIPGRAKILFIKKHVVTSSDCQIVIGFPSMKIISQDCNQHTKL
ncbi:hypothetical protein RND81_04G123000 [Saponaria officinalis]|uniref:Late embryogenesis abundant protein LEA-2 subgroup domain-containing protein n=1 Tax=Saponaria officinalis TaxID=3572 RepID=A0AAW1LND4_SAPOF